MLHYGWILWDSSRSTYEEELAEFYYLLYGDEELVVHISPPKTRSRLKHVNKILKRKNHEFH